VKTRNFRNGDGSTKRIKFERVANVARYLIKFREGGSLDSERKREREKWRDTRRRGGWITTVMRPNRAREKVSPDVR